MSVAESRGVDVPGGAAAGPLAGSGGYAMAALLVAMGVMAVLMTAAMPTWSTVSKREREAELVFRGEQYARAIQLFQRKYANTLPPSLDVLVNERFLRKKYKDPVTGGEFQLLGAGQQAAPGGPGSPPASPFGAFQQGLQQTQGARGLQTGTPIGPSARPTAGGRTGLGGPAGGPVGGIMGVTSRSTEKSLRLYNGRGAYNEWAFVPVQRVTNPGDSLGPGGGEGPGAGRNGRAGGPRGTARPTDGNRFRPPADSGGFRPAQGDSFRPSRTGGAGGR